MGPEIFGKKEYTKSIRRLRKEPIRLAEELRKVIIGYVGDDEVSVDNKQDSTQRNYGVLKKVR